MSPILALKDAVHHKEYCPFQPCKMTSQISSTSAMRDSGSQDAKTVSLRKVSRKQKILNRMCVFVFVILMYTRRC